MARRTQLAVVGAAVAVAALAAIVIATRGPKLEPIEVSQQTTYIITPTRADGWVDYPEEVDWMRRASLDAGGANAAVSLLRALGRDVLPIGVDRGALLQRLGVADAAADASALPPLKDAKEDPGPPPGLGGKAPTPAAIDWVRARCRASAQAPASIEKILGWLTQADGAIADLRTAGQAAGLYVPVSRGAGHGNFDRVNPIRLSDGAAALACHAAVKLMLGDAAASWNDADALWRLGQLIARTATGGEYAIAELFWKAAMIATVDLAASPVTSSELLSAMQARLGAKLGFPPATEAWMFHRLSILDANGTPLVAPSPPGRRSGGPLARIGTAAKLEAINRDFDAIDVAFQTPDPKQRIARVEQATPPIAGQVGGVARSMLAVDIQAVSYKRLASLALALARRQRDGGKLPASLAELPDAPKDPGTGAPFNYTVDGARFRLHGVGGDGRDDQGDPARDIVADPTEPPRLAPP